MERQSGLGRFAAKFLADEGMDLATLIAWGTLSTVCPVLLGITAVAGVTFRCEARPTLLLCQPGASGWARLPADGC